MRRYQVAKNGFGDWGIGRDGILVAIVGHDRDDRDSANFWAFKLNAAYEEGVNDGAQLLEAERAVVKRLQAEIAGLNSQLRDILSQAEIP